VWYIYSKTKTDLKILYMSLDFFFDRKKRNIKGSYFRKINKTVYFFYNNKIFVIHSYIFKIIKYIIICPKILVNKYILKYKQFKDKLYKIYKKYV
jgi:hypothetical protein